jgi:hypothetical protein
MKYIRLYEEFENKRKGVSAGNVVALDLDENGRPYYDAGGKSMSATVGVFDYPDSPVCSGSVSWEYLREKCKRVAEAHARTVHPEMFKRLDIKD